MMATGLDTADVIKTFERATSLAKVLIVEDDSDIRMALQLRMKVAGMAVLAVSDGRAALAAVPDFQPRVIVLDLGLPGIDGLDFLERIRTCEKPAPKVIVLSAWDQRQCEPLALERGASLYLEKPVAMEEVLVGIDYLLRQSP